ncbi:hypothetical protein Tco_0950493, partial [Tanacetum coccineum]
MGLCYSKDTGMSMTAYADADHAGCQDTRRSTSGSAQFLGVVLKSYGCVHSQQTMAFNSTRFLSSGKWNRGSIHLHQTFTKRKIQLLDRKARYEKHVSGNVETSGRGNGRVMVKALDDALIAPADRLEFGKCNMRLETDIKPKEATFQVVLDVLTLTPFYRAFLITFCPKVSGQVFEDLPLEQDILSFIRDLGHTRDITYLTDVNVDYLHQPWRAFATII